MKDNWELLDVFDRIVDAAKWELESLSDYIDDGNSIEERDYNSLDSALERAGELRDLLMEAINAGK